MAKKTGRTILAVLAGAVVWAVLWNAGTLGAQAAFPDTLAPDRPLTHTGVLLAYIGYSVLLSILAGFVTAAAAGAHAVTSVRWLAGLQLVLGLVFEIAFWNMTPVWYHVVFLALIVPATLYGGTLRARGRTPTRITA